MDLKLTTKRALEFEERTGKDMLEFLKEVVEMDQISIKDTINLFMAMGEGYNEETFDQWDISYKEKVIGIMNAVKEYIEGKK